MQISLQVFNFLDFFVWNVRNNFLVSIFLIKKKKLTVKQIKRSVTLT